MSNIKTYATRWIESFNSGNTPLDDPNVMEIISQLTFDDFESMGPLQEQVGEQWLATKPELFTEANPNIIEFTWPVGNKEYTISNETYLGMMKEIMEIIITSNNI